MNLISLDEHYSVVHNIDSVPWFVLYYITLKPAGFNGPNTMCTSMLLFEWYAKKWMYSFSYIFDTKEAS